MLIFPILHFYWPWSFDISLWSFFIFHLWERLFWLISRNLILSRFMKKIVKCYLFFTVELYSHMYMNHSFSIQSYIHRHLGYFHIWAILYITAMNIEVQMYFLHCALGAFRYITRNEIVRSYCSSRPRLWRLFRWSSKKFEPLDFAINSEWGSFFSHILTSTGFVLFNECKSL